MSASILIVEADLLKAMAEPRRLEILRLVGERELSAGDIAGRFEVTRPAISQHLRVLKEAGLVSERRDGTRRFYRARPERIDELRRWLDGFWEAGLSSLKRAAERGPSRSSGGGYSGCSSTARRSGYSRRRTSRGRSLRSQRYGSFRR